MTPSPSIGVPPVFPIGVQDDDRKLAGPTSPRSHSPNPAVNPRHRRDAYATLGSATCLTLSLLDFFGSLLGDRPGDTSRSALKSLLEMSKPQRSSCQATIGVVPTGRACRHFATASSLAS